MSRSKIYFVSIKLSRKIKERVHSFKSVVSLLLDASSLTHSHSRPSVCPSRLSSSMFPHRHGCKFSFIVSWFLVNFVSWLLLLSTYGCSSFREKKRCIFNWRKVWWRLDERRSVDRYLRVRQSVSVSLSMSFSREIKLHSCIFQARSDSWLKS